MPSDVATRLAGPTQLSTTIANVYGAAPSTKTVIRNVHIANTSGSDATFFMSTGSSGVDTDASRFFPGLTIAANSIVDLDCFFVLENGEYITAKAGTASALTLSISGVVGVV